MDNLELMKQRHSVRRYINKPLEKEAADRLKDEVQKINAQSGLHIRLVLDEPKAFDSAMARYGNFSGVSNYFVMAGKKGKDLEEKVGYFGQRLVLLAQSLGINSCWVALTYKKIPSAFEIRKGEKLAVVIALGYGQSSGKERKSKSASEVSNASEATPDWFNLGVEAALLAPTAINQQKFFLEYQNGKVKAKAALGVHSKMDLGIVKYQFELASGKDSSIWL